MKCKFVIQFPYELLQKLDSIVFLPDEYQSNNPPKFDFQMPCIFPQSVFFWYEQLYIFIMGRRPKTWGTCY